jgi:MFS transporter, putative metabolite transport protein
VQPAAQSVRVDYDDAPLRWFHLRVALGASGGEFSEGFGLGIIGICLNRAAPQLNLDPLWMGILGAASLASLFAGALLTGAAADRFGRRPIFGFNMAVLGILSLAQGLVHTRAELLVLRLAIGFVLGSDYAVNKAMLIEYTPRRVRGRILGLLSVMWATGYASAYFAGFALDGLGPQSWRWMLVSSAIPCFLVLPLRVTVPETPMWLTNNGRSEEAARVVRAKLGANVAPPAATPSATPTVASTAALNATVTGVSATVPSASSNEGRWRELFSPAWRQCTLVACAFFTCLVIPYFAVGTFVAQVMSAMNIESGYAGGLIYNFSLLGGAILGLLIVDRISRRSFLVGSFWIAAASTLALTLWNPLPAFAMTALFAVFAGVLSAASNLVYVYLPELFPTSLRASGIGLASAVSRIGSAFSTFLLPVIVASYGIHAALAACVAVLAAGAVICQLWAPETQNVRLENLDQIA